ncbi:MAG: dienelactone hydrolase family protein [Myxococcales bacterium]|nr:dienelactone hydrolase family protein [Myxococcales bacterium]
MRFFISVLAPSVLLVASASVAEAKIKTQEVKYQADGITMKGLIAWDDSIEEKRPGILVVHEWWGHNDYVRGRAKQLAELGYTALAVDMYGDGKKADHPSKAGEFAKAVMGDLDGAERRFRAAREVLERHPTTDPEKTAAIGYCFGGGIVLNMALRGLDLDAVASFHGSLPTEPAPEEGKVEAMVFVAHGADDPFIEETTVTKFREQMKAANVNLVFEAYEGAKHGFTNPEADKLGKKFDLPLAYDKAADEGSWARMKELFRRTFKKS